MHARKAMEAGDLEALKRVVEAHPDLLRLDHDGGRMPTLLTVAFRYERERGAGVMRPIIGWLVAQGLDLQRTLNEQLCAWFDKSPENVRWLLDRGADPDWVPSSGITVLEYALVGYWNGDAVDVLAARAKPRKALWIAAGLGDVDGVRRSLDRNGKPTKEAKRLRPPFHAAGRAALAAHPDPDDEEILVDAFLVAILNRRIAVLEYMVSRGFPLNSTIYGMPMINFAVGNSMLDVVQCLVRCGADLDIKGWRPEQSARELAREFLESTPDSPERRRIAELCGLDVDTIVAERNARPPQQPRMHPFVDRAMDLASDDASRRGRSEIDAESLLFGLLRIEDSSVAMLFTHGTGMDVDRFRDDMRDRVRAADDRVAGVRLPLRSDAQTVIDAAIAGVANRRGDLVIVFDVLRELVSDEHGLVRELLRRYGGDVSKLIAQLERGHAPIHVRSKPRRDTRSAE